MFFEQFLLRTFWDGLTIRLQGISLSVSNIPAEVPSKPGTVFCRFRDEECYIRCKVSGDSCQRLTVGRIANIWLWAETLFRHWWRYSITFLVPSAVCSVCAILTRNWNGELAFTSPYIYICDHIWVAKQVVVQVFTAHISFFPFLLSQSISPAYEHPFPSFFFPFLSFWVSLPSAFVCSEYGICSFTCSFAFAGWLDKSQQSSCWRRAELYSCWAVRFWEFWRVWARRWLLHFLFQRISSPRTLSELFVLIVWFV